MYIDKIKKLGVIKLANVGDVLVEPEEGWKRIDSSNELIQYSGSGWRDDTTYSPYKGSRRCTESTIEGCAIKFNFIGTKLRIIGDLSTNWSDKLKISIDGVEEYFSEKGTVISVPPLNYEKLSLKKGEHTVVITNVGDGYWGLDAIDIDDDGELKPYSPAATTILRVTMIDSSDHDYQLTKDEIDTFVKWYNGHTSADTHAHGLNKKIGSQISTEYLAFEKIISFEVI